MKTITFFIIVLFVGILIGITSSKQSADQAPIRFGEYNQYTLEIIDSCEYISRAQGLTHKGNCKFCAERREKEQYK